MTKISQLETDEILKMGHAMSHEFGDTIILTIKLVEEINTESLKQSIMRFLKEAKKTKGMGWEEITTYIEEEKLIKIRTGHVTIGALIL